jgi:hypothetical protein
MTKPNQLAEDNNASSILRKPWLHPTLQKLPKLTELTLQSGGIIPGGGTGGGGGIF